METELSREQRLRLAERDMAYATRWIEECRMYVLEQRENLRYHLLLRAKASEEYAEALAMPEEIEEQPQPQRQGELFQRAALRESPQPPPDAPDPPFGGLLG
jgi:hypothetical protein